MATQHTIAVDMDDVLFDFIDYFFDWHDQQYGTALQVSDVVADAFWEVWGGTREEAAERIPRFWAESDLLAMEPMPGAVDALHALKTHYRLIVISARDTRTTDISRAWLDRYFDGIFDDATLGISDPMRHPDKRLTKADLCLQLGVHALIDDQLRNVQECADVGIRGILFGDSSWNQSDTLPKGVVRVADWDSVREVLIDK